MLPSEYQVPSGCTRLTSDYNLFFIFIKEQDKKNSSKFTKNIHMMTDKCKCLVFTKPSYFSRIVARTKCPLTCSASSCSRATPSTRAYSRPVCWCQALSASSLVSGTPRYFLASLANFGYSFFLALHQSREFLSASMAAFDDGLGMFGGLKRKNPREIEFKV